MEHVYAALLVSESGAELNEENLSAVLDAAGCEAGASRTKALVAALEGVDVPREGGSTASDPGAGTEEPVPVAADEGDDDGGDPVPTEGTQSR